MALDRPEPWRYFGETEDEALDELRDRLTSDPGDPALRRELRRAGQFLEKATGRFFRPRAGSIQVDGTDTDRLYLPHPVISADQLEEALDVVVVIAPDTEAVDLVTLTVNAGAAVGDDDPRNDPWIELTTTDTTRAYGFRARFPWGGRRVSVTATWGYVEEDGTTPEPILDCLVRLVTLNLADPASAAGSAPAAGALLSETVEGRSYTYSGLATSEGLTLDRTVDAILRGYRRPTDVIVSRGRSLRS